MNNRRLTAFIDALVAGRRLPRSRIDHNDAALLRTAIDLRASRPGEAQPSEQFVSELHRRLSDQVGVPATTNNRSVRQHRGRFALGAVAASAVLVGGTVVVTDAFDQSSTQMATSVPQGRELRTGTFVTTDSRVLGQIVAYHGDPSWVFMNVALPHYNGPITCELQAADGSVVSFGTFQVHDGVGQFSKRLEVEVENLRGARLVNSEGSPVAAASFA